MKSLETTGLSVLDHKIPHESLAQLPPARDQMRYSLYQVGGVTKFPIYGVTGGLTPQIVSFLISPDREKTWGFDPNVHNIVEAEAHFSAALRNLKEKTLAP